MRCPACNYPLSDPDAPCRACGHRAGPRGAPEDPWAAPRVSDTADGHAAPHHGPSSLPWEEGYSLPNLLETIRRVTVATSQTFAEAPRDVGITPALLFGLLLATAFGLIGSGLQAIFIPHGDAIPGELGRVLDVIGQPSVLSLVITPVQVLLGLFIGTAIVHLGLMIVGGANSGFEATFRVLAYATGALAPLQIIPVLGPFVAGVWGLVLEVIALKELHETTGGKAAFAVLAPLLLACLCVGGFVVFASGMILGR